jgi:hypothetical protein
MWGAPLSTGWRHSVTMGWQWFGTSKPQAQSVRAKDSRFYTDGDTTFSSLGHYKLWSTSQDGNLVEGFY